MPIFNIKLEIMKKLKLLIAIIGLSFAAITVKAQAFAEGTKVVSLGYGFPNLGKTVLKVFDDEVGYKATGFGPIHARFEYGLTDKFGLGASVNFNTYGAEYNSTSSVWNGSSYQTITYKETFKATSISILVRFNKHWDLNDQVDVFSGIGVGYKYSGFKSTTDNPTGTQSLTISNPIPVGFEWTWGMRYFFTENIGAYIELGLAKSILQAGVTAKF